MKKSLKHGRNNDFIKALKNWWDREALSSQVQEIVKTQEIHMASQAAFALWELPTYERYLGISAHFCNYSGMENTQTKLKYKL